MRASSGVFEMRIASRPILGSMGKFPICKICGGIGSLKFVQPLPVPEQICGQFLPCHPYSMHFSLEIRLLKVHHPFGLGGVFHTVQHKQIVVDIEQIEAAEKV